jgi:hypothetical protein
VFQTIKFSGLSGFKNKNLNSSLQSYDFFKSRYEESNSGSYDPLKSRVVAGLAKGLNAADLVNV